MKARASSYLQLSTSHEEQVALVKQLRTEQVSLTNT